MHLTSSEKKDEEKKKRAWACISLVAISRVFFTCTFFIFSLVKNDQIFSAQWNSNKKVKLKQ